MAKHVDFYYDFSSPNAYMSAVQLKALLERTQATATYRPILLGGIFKSLNVTPPMQQSGHKAKYMPKDMERWAKKHGIPFRFPSVFPMNTVKALRGALAVERLEPAKLVPYVEAVFRAYWAEDRDISQDAVLGEIVRGLGLDPDRFFSAIGSPEIKDDLRRHTEEAEQRGVFGTPTFFVADEMFWGKDRLDFVEDELRAG